MSQFGFLTFPSIQLSQPLSYLEYDGLFLARPIRSNMKKLLLILPLLIVGCSQSQEGAKEIIKQDPDLIDQRMLLVCDQTTEKTHPGYLTRQSVFVLESSISSRQTEDEFTQARERFHPENNEKKYRHIFTTPYLHWGIPLVAEKSPTKIAIYSQAQKDLLEDSDSGLVNRSWSIDRKTLEATYYIKGGGPEGYGVEFTKHECWIGDQAQLLEIDAGIVAAKQQHDSELVL